MDIFELDVAFGQNPEAQRALEDLIFAGVREALNGWIEDARDAKAALDEIKRAGCDGGPGNIENQETEWIERLHDDTRERKDLLRLLAALVGSSDPNDYAIDCAAIEQVIRERRERLAFLYASPASQARPVDLSRRRGRPTLYRWQEFAAEMTRRCVGGPISDQAALERHMMQWCADKWDTEPANSTIREWVSPTFRAIQGADYADDLAPDLSANTP